VIFFDLLSALFGLADLVLRRRVWSRITRTHEVSDAVDASLRGKLTQRSGGRRRPWAYALVLTPLVALGIVATNDVLSIGPCGDRTPLLWDPIVLRPAEHPVLEVAIDRRADGDRVHATVRATVRAPEPGTLDLRVFDGRRRAHQQRLEATLGVARREVELEWPLGWDTRRIAVSLSGPGLQCLVDRRVPTHVVEVGPDGMRINGEPFLVKGMVPTFSTPRVGMEVDEGYAQLQEVGVNTVRIYHPPTEAILTAARRHHMLLIPQPEGSTWDSVDSRSFLDRVFYERRWRELVEDTEGEPFVLMLNAGNELEIDDRSPEMLRAIRDVLHAASGRNHGSLTTYSTFTTFVDYPVDVLGINMLDSGPTYWEGALDLVHAMGRPFYASEFGGFVAFFESPTPLLRQWRMWRQSETLRRRGALGAVFFASHDNWSQAVPPGSYNDPFSGDHPDDRRGFWDPENEPKPELAMLTHLLADLEAEVVDETIEPGMLEARLRVRNRRRYSLERISIDLGAEESWSLGRLSPGEATDVVLPLSALRAAPGYPDVTLRFSHQSHHGLRGRGRWRVSVPDPTNGPVLLGGPVFDMRRSEGNISFTSLRAGGAQLVVPPAWSSVSIGGDIVENTGGRIALAIEGPTREVSEVEMSDDGARWRPFDGARLGTGDRFVRFRLPPARTAERQRSLVLAGLAATRVFTRTERGTDAHPAHPYRETLIDVSEESGIMTLRMRRQRARYLAARSSPTGEAIPIELAPPFVFAPRRTEVIRGPR